jgi:ketopantoate reductase
MAAMVPDHEDAQAIAHDSIEEALEVWGSEGFRSAERRWRLVKQVTGFVDLYRVI